MSLSSYYQYAAHDFWEEHADEFSKGYGFVDGGPWNIFAIVSVYLMFVTWIGPRFMRNRPAYDLKHVLYYYNISHIVGNGVCCIPAFIITRGLYDCWSSRKTGDPQNPHHHLLLYLSFVYFCAKFLDLFDTVFFILRKKNNQVTFLHVVHHSVMPFCTYIALHFAPIGRTSIIGIVNSIVHTVMYTYYFLSSIPSMREHLWWKKYLTQMQIVQFIIFFAHSLQGIFLVDPKDFPIAISYLELVNALFFMKSFTDFFLKTYNKEKKDDTLTESFEADARTKGA